ncbi:MAG: glutamate 5-kinase [Candidatus Eremiobacteraeota bacterium]|nr:glutamate 5-kinase [Candidatus Eremiobacteraeota bacterium]
MNARASLAQTRTLVVKLGTSVCLNAKGAPNGEVLLPLAREIVELRRGGVQVVVVSSGAVGMGRALDLHGHIGNQKLAQKQALAALGQVELMNVYRRIFELLGVLVAQVLLTRRDLDSRERYLNARNTLLTLLRAEVLPVINENDSVATDEIRFGDNDILACLVGSVVEADLVVNLTQTEGLLARQEDGGYRVVAQVEGVDEETFGLVEEGTSRGGTGGMRSKLLAAQAAADYGGAMVIARAHEPNVLQRLLAGEPLGTLFVPPARRPRSRKRWLAAGAVCKGTLVVDAGARKALVHGGRSLLPVGVKAIEGEFTVGDVVAIAALDGAPLGRGLTNYNSEDLARIKGQPTQEIEEILGFRGYDEVIHRDNLFIRKDG